MFCSFSLILAFLLWLYSHCSCLFFVPHTFLLLLAFLLWFSSTYCFSSSFPAFLAAFTLSIPFLLYISSVPLFSPTAPRSLFLFSCYLAGDTSRKRLGGTHGGRIIAGQMMCRAAQVRTSSPAKSKITGSSVSWTSRQKELRDHD